MSHARDLQTVYANQAIIVKLSPFPVTVWRVSETGIGQWEWRKQNCVGILSGT